MRHVLAVAGTPISHSRSPAMHRAALDWSGLEGTYDAIQCDGRQFAELVQSLRRGDYTGLNVTMPHKRLAGQLADSLDTAGLVSGSVNTLRMEGNELLGVSTDARATVRVLDELGLPDAPVLVLGSGGAAAAVLAAGGTRCVLTARDQQRARDLAALFSKVSVVPFGTTIEGAIVVNATTLGMAGESIPEGILNDATALIDLPYADRQTPAVQRGRELGIQVVDGIRFLAIQAAASFEWWTGDNVPVEVFEEAARNG